MRTVGLTLIAAFALTACTEQDLADFDEAAKEGVAEGIERAEADRIYRQTCQLPSGVTDFDCIAEREAREGLEGTDLSAL